MSNPYPIRQLILTALPGIPHIEAGDDLTSIILDGLARAALSLRAGDVVVLAQKIVSKAEGRRVHLGSVQPSPQAHELARTVEKDPRLIELILGESRQILRSRPGLLIVEHRLGFVCANAGIDHSNVAGGEELVLLLPQSPDRSARDLRQALCESTGVAPGVLIVDSHGRSWRRGTVGVTVGLAGMPGLQDARGLPDLFGRLLRVTEIGAADELAAAASLMMGQAAEGTPVIHARGFPYPLREASLPELLRDEDQDLFR